MASAHLDGDWITVKGRKYRRRQAGGGAGEPGAEQALGWRRQRAQRKAVVTELGGKGGGKTAGGKTSAKGQPGSKGGGKQGRYKEGAGAQAGTYNSTSYGPWVACANKQCKGHNGGTSFKYLSSIGVGANGLACMGCSMPWEDSLAEALAAGAIPDFVADEEPAASPFAGANAAPAGSNWTCKMASPFATPSFAALPKDIQDLVDERLRADFLLVLDPAKVNRTRTRSWTLSRTTAPMATQLPPSSGGACQSKAAGRPTQTPFGGGG